MKKLTLTLGLLLSCVSMAYGMQQAIEQHNWRQVAFLLKNQLLKVTDFDLLCSTDTAILNVISPQGGSLLLTLISNSGEACEQALVALIKQKKLSLLARDTKGYLLCQNLTDTNKKKLLELIDQHEIDNPFTYTVRDNPLPCTQILKGNITLNPKGPEDYVYISADNKFRLSITMIVLAGAVLAATTLYKWYAKKLVTDDDEDAQDDEHEEETAGQVTA